MNLAIDIGNSRVKIGLFDKNDLILSEILDKDYRDRVLSLLNEQMISRAILSSVKADDNDMEEALKERVSLVVLNDLTPLPFKNLYKTPKTLGKDRIAAVAGALTFSKDKDVLVIDAGTCITCEFINAGSEYLGGSISPGMSIRFKSLNDYTGKLPLVAQNHIPELIGATTKESIESGVINGIIEELNGLINQYRQRYPNLSVVMTGGDSQFFETSINCPIFADPNLVLIGLNRILQHNAS